MESFLHPIADELKVLTAGMSGVTVAGFSEPQVVQALALQFTTYMPARDKLLNAIRGNGEHPGNVWDFAGVLHMRRYYYPPIAPDDRPPSKHAHFDVRGESTPRRTAETFSESVAWIDDARRAGGCKASVRALSQKEDFKGCSRFICPSLEDKGSYLSLKYLWYIGPDPLPYDTMHLLFFQRRAELVGAVFW